VHRLIEARSRPRSGDSDSSREKSTIRAIVASLRRPVGSPEGG
jgi:hypothetical protein